MSMGQKLYRQFPYLLAALQGWDRRLPKMAESTRKPHKSLLDLGDTKASRLNPPSPQTNAFIVPFPQEKGRHIEARDLVAQETEL